MRWFGIFAVILVVASLANFFLPYGVLVYVVLIAFGGLGLLSALYWPRAEDWLLDSWW